MYLCGDTLISRVETPDAEQVEKNLSYVKRLAESTAVPVTFGLIPSAAEVWKDKLPDGAASWDQTDLLEESGVDFLTALSTHAGDQVFYPHGPSLDHTRGLLRGKCSAGDLGNRTTKGRRLYARNGL